MDQDEKHKIYHLGFESGQKHIKSSPETLELFKKMDDKIDNLKDDITELKVLIAGMPQKMIELSDLKYASKTTERAVYGLFGVVGVSVIGALMSLVLVK